VRVHALAEAAKLSAEAEKLRAEARDLDRPALSRPGTWVALGSALVALIGGIFAIPYGYFNHLKVDADQRKELSELQGEISKSQSQLAEAQRQKLADDVVTLGAAKTKVEQDTLALRKQYAALQATASKEAGQLQATKKALDDASKQESAATWGAFTTLAEATVGKHFIFDNDLGRLAAAVRNLSVTDQGRVEEYLSKQGPPDPTLKFLTAAVMYLATSKAVYNDQLAAITSYKAEDANLPTYFYSYAWQIVVRADTPLKMDQRVALATQAYAQLKKQAGFTATSPLMVTFLSTMSHDLISKVRDPYIDHLRAVWQIPPQALGQGRTEVACGAITGQPCLVRAAAASGDIVVLSSRAIPYMPVDHPPQYEYKVDSIEFHLADLRAWVAASPKLGPLSNPGSEALKTIPDEEFLNLLNGH
jgi:hypothetical protein